MRAMLPIALLFTGCVTSDVVDPDDLAIPDVVGARDNTTLDPAFDPGTARTGRFISPDAPVLQTATPALHELYTSIASDVAGDGYLLARLDGGPMTCFDGVVRRVCRTNAIDWSPARLAAEGRLQMETAMDRGATAPGVIAIARGHWAPILRNARYHPDGAWVLSEAWVAEPGGAASEGEFVRIEDNGIMCFVAPCPHLTESQLYDDRSVAIDELDFAPSNLRQALIDRVVAATHEPSGVIVAGERYYEAGTYDVATGRTVTAAYRRLPVKQY